MTVDKYESEDLRVIAQSEGISYDEALRRFGWHQDFADVVDAIRNKYPEKFASSAMEVEGREGAEIQFMGRIPEGAIDELEALPIPVTLVGGSKYSESRVRAMVESVHYDLRGEIQELSISTSYNATKGTVDVVVEAPLMSSEDVRRIENLSQKTTFWEDAVVAPIRIRVTSKPSAGSDTIRGGAILTLNGTNQLTCTSGWPVRGTGGTTEGLITAEHCDGDFDYSGRDVLTYQRRLPYSKGDIQYNSSTEHVGYGFYHAVGNYRDIDGPVGNPSVGQYLCVFGRGSDSQECDRVRGLGTCRDEYCNLVAMDGRNARSGDSGGPWYYGSRFYGVHSGWRETWLGRDQDQWTPLNNTLDDLNVRVRVGPDG